MRSRRQRGEDPGSSEPRSMSEPERGRARILVVEDYDDSRDMYEAMLTYAGYDVVTARNGQELLTWRRRSRSP